MTIRKTYLFRLFSSEHEVSFDLKVFGVFEEYVSVYQICWIACTEHNTCAIGFPAFHVENLRESGSGRPEECFHVTLDHFEGLSAIQCEVELNENKKYVSKYFNDS